MRRLLWVLTFAAAGAATVACASGGEEGVSPATSLDAATRRGPFGVGVTTMELVDTSRPTQANRGSPGADERRLVVEVWYPADALTATPEARDAPLAREAAPYPLIVFAHGLSSFSRQSVAYTQHLASHGYVVAAPGFPLSGLGSPGGPRLADLINQPGDVSFVIDSFFGFNEEEGHRFEDAVDRKAVGMTGHSLGGITTLLTVYGPFRDDRVRAALPIAASGCFLTEEMVADISLPILLLTGSGDLILAPSWSRRAYELANPPRYHVELAGANHTRFSLADLDDARILELLPSLGERREEAFGDDARRVAEALGVDLQGLAACGPEPPEAGTGPAMTWARQQELLRAFATPFFDAYLRESDAAKRFLEDELPGLVPEAHAEFDPE